MHQDPNDNWQEPEESPNGVLWPIRQAGWFIEKHVLWPIADSFRKLSTSLRYRSPFAYVGVTLLVTVTAGAIAAAVFFYNQSEENKVVTTADSQPTESVPIAPTPTAPPVGVDTTPNSGNSDTTLQGVVPNFTTAGDSKQKKSNSGNSNQLPETVVKPAPKPEAPPLKVAHSFAETFANYEVGKKGAADRFTKTATNKLARDLKKKPPKLPASGKVPKATVVNVVRGKKQGDEMAVSVSLMRSGATSELRLGLTRQGKGWLVSEVRG